MSTAEPIDSYHGLVRSDVFPVLPDALGTVLDFGGGIGATAVELKRIGRADRVVVIDRVDGQLGGVDRVCRGDLEDDELLVRVLGAEGPFDTILALDVLEHLRDPWRVVEILRDALRPSGVIVASIPNVNSHRLLMPLLLRGRYDLTDSGILDRTHLRWFARHGAVELLSRPGLQVEEVRANVVRRKERLVDKVSCGALTRFLALQYVIRSRRID